MLKGIVNTYRVVWVILILAFGTGIWWFALRSPEAQRRAEEFDPSKVKVLRETDEQEPKDAREEIKDSTPRDIKLSDADVVISGVGTTMSLWVKKGSREEAEFRIEEGTMVFEKEGERSLLLHVTDGSFASNAGQVQVKGSITGNFEGTNHYFEARSLVWSQTSNNVQAQTVRYVGPYVDVTGDTMDIDVAAGKIRFDGPVSAGI